MPVVAAVKRRRQFARRRDVGIAIQVVRDLVRILLVHAGECEIRESLRRFRIEFGGAKRKRCGEHEEKKSLHSRFTIIINAGIDKQLITAAAPNAIDNPKRCPIAPTSSEPIPMPVSNAHTMLPNVRARRDGSVFVNMNETNDGYIHPNPAPKTNADAIICHRVCANTSSANAIGISENDE